MRLDILFRRHTRTARWTAVSILILCAIWLGTTALAFRARPQGRPQPPSDVAEGRVLDANSRQPIVRATVEVVDPTVRRPASVRALTTRADGSFDLRGLPDHAYIAFAASGYATHRQSLKSLRKRGATVLLQKAARLAGVVRHAQSGQLTSALIVVTEQSTTNINTRSIRTTGTFDIADILPGPVSVIATGPGLAPESVQFDLRPGQTLTGVVLSLAPAATVSGRVTDESGNSVVGANVSVHYTDALPRKEALEGFAGGITRTMADGHFHVRNIKPETPFILRVREGRREATTGRLVLGPREERDASIRLRGKQ